MKDKLETCDYMLNTIGSLEAIDKALEAYKKVEGGIGGLKLETIEPLKDKHLGWVIGLSRNEYQGFLDHRVTNYLVTVIVCDPISQDDHDVVMVVQSITKVEKS